MCFGQVLAAGAHLFPDERHGIQPQNIDAGVGDEQHLVEHGPKDGRIAVIQIPLKAVEGGPDPLLHAVMPREVAAAYGGKDLAQRPLVLIGLGTIGKDVIELLDTRDSPTELAVPTRDRPTCD